MESKRSIVYMIRCRHVRNDGTECGDKEVDIAPTVCRCPLVCVECYPPHEFRDGCARSMVYVADGYLTAEVFPLVLAD